MPDPDTPDTTESFGDLLSEYERTHARKSDDATRQLEGTVIKVSADSVFLDIGYKIEGVLPLSAFKENESPQPGAFSEDDNHMLQSLATYAITAIQEVRLLDALQEAAQLLISQPTQKVLDRLCVMANDLLNTSSSAIWWWLSNDFTTFSWDSVMRFTASSPCRTISSSLARALAETPFCS